MKYLFKTVMIVCLSVPFGLNAQTETFKLDTIVTKINGVERIFYVVPDIDTDLLMYRGVRNLSGATYNTELYNRIIQIEIDGCEYFVHGISESTKDGYGDFAYGNESFGMTHKGNCKNPIHCHNGGKEE